MLKLFFWDFLKVLKLFHFAQLIFLRFFVGFKPFLILLRFFLSFKLFLILLVWKRLNAVSASSAQNPLVCFWQGWAGLEIRWQKLFALIFKNDKFVWKFIQSFGCARYFSKYFAQSFFCARSRWCASYWSVSCNFSIEGHLVRGGLGNMSSYS